MTSKRYGVGHEATLAANAIATIKETGKVTVSGCSHGLGPGFYAHWVRADGRLGMSFGAGSETESEAWLSAAITLAAYKPGALQMTSREFGLTRIANVQSEAGSLESLELRRRLEIRKVGGLYEVFLVERRYLRGEEPRDVKQHPEGAPFATLQEAAGYVGRYIADYEGAAAEDRESAIEAQADPEPDVFEGDA